MANDTLQLDWRNVSGKSCVTPVRNQGNCGSCYAFAAVGVLESALMIAYPDKFVMSLNISESSAMANTLSGCDGGNADNVIDSAVGKNVTTEAIWPYLAEKYNKTPPANYSLYINDPSNFVQPSAKTLHSYRDSLTSLKDFVDIQPTAVFVSLTLASCGTKEVTIIVPNHTSTNINHAVVAVGYDMGNKY
jgi:C1A family cysteine protease